MSKSNYYLKKLPQQNESNPKNDDVFFFLKKNLSSNLAVRKLWLENTKIQKSR